MMEEDGEIEYLDEDEDIVQQYVQNAPTFPTPVIQSVYASYHEDIEDQIAPLLVERKRVETKRKLKEDDSDYDPSQDLHFKKRKIVHKKPPPHNKPESTYIKIKPAKSNSQQTQNLNKKYESKLKSLPNLTVQKKTVSKVPEVVKQYKKVAKKLDSVNERRKLDIRIPDYEDPLCLPVRAIKRDEYDLKKLKLWNNLCLEQFRKSDGMLRPQNGEVVSSVKTVVLRNMKNKYTGKIDTSVYGKTTVENSAGQKKTETYQGTLPKYREKKVLNSFPLVLSSQRYFKHTYEAVLTKEEQKDGDLLVVYKPREAVSAVYKCIPDNTGHEEEEDAPREHKRVMKELTCCRACAPCYQASWRGVRKENKPESLRCAVCARTFVSVYNLLAHLNTNHRAADVARHRAALSATLASVVEYHYRCRICRERFHTIKQLRKHVPKHQGMEVFKCEIGNHMAS